MELIRNESCHTERLKKAIIEGHKINVFDRTELDAKIFWGKFAKIMKHIQSLADYVDLASLPLGLSKVYIDLISSHLEIIKDLLFISYGLILDTNPKSNEFVDERNRDNILALGFWALDNQKDIENVCNISSEWINNFINIDKRSYDNLEIFFERKDKTHISSFNHLDNNFLQSYIYAPYQDVSPETAVYVRNKINESDEIMRSLFSLSQSVMMTPLLIFKNYDVLVKEFRKSKIGEKMISCWRNDYYLPKESLLSKLKEKKDLKPWVDKVCMFHEGKIEKKELFVDLTISIPQHNPEINKTRNWICIFTIYAILQEYDDCQKIVLDIKPFFYNDEDAARKFLKQIRGLEPTMITSLVKKLVDKEKFPDALKSKNFCDVLIKHNLYNRSYSNWNAQV